MDLACFIELSRAKRQNIVVEMHLTEKSVFHFECRKCGVCCGSGLEIYLNSLDVWKLRNHLRMPSGETIEKYLSVERRAEYGSFPLCLIRHAEERCRFQDERLCSIHPARPASCRLFPVTHLHGWDGKTFFELASDFDFCKGGEGAPEITLESWLSANSIADYEKVIEIQKSLTPLLRARLKDSEMDFLFRILFDFDAADGFPFRGEYPDDRWSAEAALEWIERETLNFMAGIKK